MPKLQLAHGKNLKGTDWKLLIPTVLLILFFLQVGCVAIKKKV